MHIAPNFKFYTLQSRRENGIFPFDYKSNYLMNHQAGFFKKDFLLAECGIKETAQQNEIRATKSIKERINLGYAPAIGLVPYNWYENVCRKGKLTEIGKKMLKEAELEIPSEFL